VHQWLNTDLSYSRVHAGFGSLAAVIDWFSWCELAWAVSMTMDVGFCLEALERAFGTATPANLSSSRTGRVAEVKSLVMGM
jgi:putative transposase